MLPSARVLAQARRPPAEAGTEGTSHEPEELATQHSAAPITWHRPLLGPAPSSSGRSWAPGLNH